MKKIILILFFGLVANVLLAQTTTRFLYAKSLQSELTQERELPIITKHVYSSNKLLVYIYDPEKQELITTLRAKKITVGKYHSYYPDSNFTLVLKDKGKIVFETATNTTTFFDTKGLKECTNEYLFSEKDVKLVQTEFYINGNKKSVRVSTNLTAFSFLLRMDLSSLRWFTLWDSFDPTYELSPRESYTDYFYKGGIYSKVVFNPDYKNDNQLVKNPKYLSYSVFDSITQKQLPTADYVNMETNQRKGIDISFDRRGKIKSITDYNRFPTFEVTENYQDSTSALRSVNIDIIRPNYYPPFILKETEGGAFFGNKEIYTIVNTFSYRYKTENIIKTPLWEIEVDSLGKQSEQLFLGSKYLYKNNCVYNFL